MTKRIGLALALLVLPLWSSAAQAHGPVGFKFNLGGSLYLDIAPICGGGKCGHGCGAPGGFGGGGGGFDPWYSYWPLEGHFQTPAMPQYPYWPAMGSAGEHGTYTPPYWHH